MRLSTLVTKKPTTTPLGGKPKSAPELLPADVTPRQVFLERELWDRLSVVAAFQTRANQLLKLPGVLSRNEVIAEFLLWATEEFWEEKGGELFANADGEPVDPEAWEKRAAEHAAAIRTKLDAAAKKKRAEQVERSQQPK